MIKENSKAPDFKLLGDDGKEYSLTSLQGNNVVLYFYPKDSTPGCTREACDFRDNLEQLTNYECIVLGVSKDNVASHNKFKDKYNLNFRLLCDTDLKVHKLYNALNEEKTIRSTFLIDKKGNIIKIWPKVTVSGHVEEVLKVLQQKSVIS